MTAQDVDVTAVHMSYVQLALLDIPAIVDGDSLNPTDVRDWWVTPARATAAWDRKMAAYRAAAVKAPTVPVVPVGWVEPLVFI